MPDRRAKCGVMLSPIMVVKQGGAMPRHGD